MISQKTTKKKGSPFRMDRDGLTRVVFVTAVLLVFWPVTDNGFINFDDPSYITENSRVLTGVTVENLRWAFTAMDRGNWHPLTWLSHMMDVQLFGLNAGGHHLVNVLFHLANTLMLLAVFRTMTGDYWQSVLVAALFAFHPLHVESVAWASERKDVLSTLFWMVSIWCYARYTSQPAVHRYMAVVAGFVVGLMAKPMLVTLPFVLLLLDVWPLRRFSAGGTGAQDRWRTAGVLLKEKVPLMIITAAASVIAFLAQHKAGAVGPLGVTTLWHRAGNALVSYVGYIEKTIWPVKLGVFYPHPGRLPLWQIGGAFVFLGSVSYLVVRAARRRPYLMVGWFWFLGTLVPVIGLVQVGSQGMADRYAYIPLIGLFIIAAWGGAELTARCRRRRLINGVLSTAALLVLIMMTRSQIAWWQDDVSLYEHTLSVTEKNHLILNNLALAQAARGRTDDALRLYHRALALEPAFQEAHNNLGNLLMGKGDLAAAAACYRRALRINPKYELAILNLGLALEKMGDLSQAAAQYESALRINPRSEKAYNYLGNNLARRGKTAEATALYRLAVAVNPGDGQSRYNLAVALENSGSIKEAVDSYEQSVRLSPRLKQAHNNLGNIFFKQGNAWGAIEHYNRAIQIDPLYDKAVYNMGAALESVGKLKAAAMYYTQALEIDPDLEAAHVRLGAVLMTLGVTEPAVVHLEQALRLNPDNRDARDRLESIRFVPDGGPNRH